MTLKEQKSASKSKKGIKPAKPARARSTKSSKKSSKPRVSLEPLREQLQVLVDRANERANVLINNQLDTSSRAFQEAKRTLKRQSSRVDDEQLFKSNLRTRQQINREFARVQAFLGDYTSTELGAKQFTTDLTSLQGAFGGQWEAKTGERFDTSRINKEIAKEAFDMYRKVVEEFGGWERAVGVFQGKESLIGYGSEVLITNIYDMYVNHYDSGILSEQEIRVRALEMLEQAKNTYEEMSQRQRIDYDYGIVFDDEGAQARRAFYAYKFDLRSKK